MGKHARRIGWAFVGAGVLAALVALSGSVASCGSSSTNGGTQPGSDATPGGDGPLPCGDLCNPTRCGDAGRDCLGGQCVSGICQPTSITSEHAHRIQLDDDYVYWMLTDYRTTATSKGLINRARKDGTKTTPVLTLLQSGDFALTSDGLVYTQGSSGAAAADGAIGYAKKDGTDGATIYGSRRGPGRIAVEGNAVFWTEGNATGSTDIHRGSVDGTAPDEIVVTGQAAITGLVVDAQRVYWLTASNPSSGIAPGAVSAASRAANAATNDAGVAVLAPTAHLPSCLQLTGTLLYFAPSRSAVQSFDLQTSTLAAVPGTNDGTCVAVGTDALYFEVFGGNILRVPRQGGTAALMHASEGNVLDMAVDDKAVYWTTDIRGLFKLAK